MGSKRRERLVKNSAVDKVVAVWALIFLVATAIVDVFSWLWTNCRWLQIIAPIFIFGWLSEVFAKQIYRVGDRYFGWMPDWLAFFGGLFVGAPLAIVGFWIADNSCVLKRTIPVWVPSASASLVLFTINRYVQLPEWALYSSVEKWTKPKEPVFRPHPTPFGTGSVGSKDATYRADL